ncbi:MAG: hypothetical protein E4H13_10010 [Calditrichales bacterium]|nr:MAG: hypothetical protein E4H13_10010 [Calditrichales bacterium]
MKTGILVFILLFCFGCQKEKETEQLQQAVNESATANTGQLPQLSDDQYVAIYEAQELIKISQDDITLREEYCQRSWLSQQHVFISMGIGRLRNPLNGQPVPQHMAERAALMDARRWAAYGESWLNNNFHPPFGQLEKYVNHSNQVINRSIVGDSLFLFLATTLD